LKAAIFQAAYLTFHNYGCSMLGIVFTTRREASTFVATYTDGPVPTIEEGTPISVGDITVAVTGAGKINATLATERLLRTHDLTSLLHAGTCVSLSEELDSGTVLGASFVLEGDRVELENPTYPRMPLSCPLEVSQEGTLVTQDHTADGKEKSYWERLADARDHTGYAVAYVAAQHGTTCHIVKAVSGSAGDSPDHEDVCAAEEEVAAVLQQFLSSGET
jgi:nucleoside phosphorylase